MFMWGILLGIVIGGVVGMGVCCCCMIANNGDDDDYI